MCVLIVHIREDNNHVQYVYVFGTAYYVIISTSSWFERIFVMLLQIAAIIV